MQAVIKKTYRNYGFTLLELILAIALLGILATAVVVMLNPAERFAKTRNYERILELNIILNSMGENITGNRGTFDCASGDVPTSTPTRMASSSPNYNIAPCLVPAYLSFMPFDPKDSSAHYTGITDYDTGYTIVQNATTGIITVSAPSAELGEIIEVSR